MNPSRIRLLQRFSFTFACSLGLVGAAACGGSTNNGDFGQDSGAPDSGSTTHADSGGGSTPDGGGMDQDSGTSTQPDSGTPAGLVTVALNSCVPTVYTVSTTIGTQSFELLFDTGSTTLAVAGSTCSCMGATPAYTPGSTAVDQKQSVTAMYGSGQWTGEIYQDNVAVDPSLTAQTKLASMTSETGFFGNMPQCTSQTPGIQGLIGFGPAGAASMGTNGFFDDYVAQHSVPNVFSIQLCDSSGTLWLGGYDPSATAGAPQYTPMDMLATGMGPLDSLYYAVNLASATVNGTNVPIGPNGTAVQDVVVDTGTSAFLISTNSYNALTAAIQADATFTQIFGASFFPTAANSLSTVACKAGLTQTKAQLDAMLPAMTLTFGTSSPITVQALPTESYLEEVQGEWCSTLAGTDPSALGGLAGIFGAPIIKSNVVIYDRAQQRIGFAPHAASCQ